MLKKSINPLANKRNIRWNNVSKYNAIVDSFLRKILIRMITVYQRRISPHKRFSCAYRVVHRTHSCSQAVKIILQKNSLGTSIPLIRQQFRQCRQAALKIRDRQTQARHHSPKCRKFATPESLLFPTLSDRILTGSALSQTEEPDGYEQSRRDRKRHGGGGTGPEPYNYWCCDGSCLYCADFELGADCCVDGIGGCDGCDTCACAWI